MKSQRKQAFQIVLSHVRLLMVAPCCHGDRRKAHHAVDLDHASINRNLIALSQTDEALAGMATTLALVDFTENSAKITYVGNTRVYAVVNGKYLKQLTRDDTTLEYLLATGQLDVSTAESFNRKNEITACFGAGNPALLKLKQIDVSGQDTLILTSDGIHDYVSLDEMEDIYCAADDKMELCKKLIEQVVENGSMDDMSAILISKIRQ